MLYIYAEKITPRLQYIIDILFAGNEVTLTVDAEQFHNYTGPKINYSRKKFSHNELLIQPVGLLAETGIKKKNIACSEWHGLKIFFSTKGEIPFDIFSASFYLLSRYEEYLPHKKDSYGRFSHEESLAFKEGFLQLPLVNLWMQQLGELLQERFPGFKFKQTNFSFLPTYDIDIAYAYKGKSLLKKLLIKLKRKQTSLNGKDLFDVYDWLDELHEKHRLSPVYFFLLAKRNGEYDKNLSPGSKPLQQLIKDLSAKYATGIHPSWESFHDEEALKREIRSLKKINGKTVENSRQHYIQFTLPHTYRTLVNAGIINEYSMGYGSINGFRASYANPFYWYDLMKDEATTLLVHPFCYMEANSFFEQKLHATQAAEELQHYHDVVKQVNGQLITIFHNHFLTEEEQWQPWRGMYTRFLEKNF